MRKMPRLVSVLMLLLLAVSSCREQDDLPLIPHISYIGITPLMNEQLGIHDRAVLAFSYEDGDGDIGLRASDTLPPYEYDLFINFFEQRMGEWEEVYLRWYNQETEEWDTLSLNGRLPLLTPAGNYKGIKGEIYDTIFIYNFNSPYDTVKFTVTIQDRALNLSNTIETPPVVVPRAGSTRKK